MMISCSSRVCRETAESSVASIARQSVKPDWKGSHATFIKSLSMVTKEKELDDSSSPSSLSLPPPPPFLASPFVNPKLRRQVDSGFSFGPSTQIFPASPAHDIFLRRQEYIRSYTFTTQEEEQKSHPITVLDKTKRWFKKKKEKMMMILKKEQSSFCGYKAKNCWNKVRYSLFPS